MSVKMNDIYIKATNHMNCYLRITMIEIYKCINWGAVCFQIITVKITEDVTSPSKVWPYNSSL